MFKASRQDTAKSGTRILTPRSKQAFEIQSRRDFLEARLGLGIALDSLVLMRPKPHPSAKTAMTKHGSILLIENDENDIFFVKKALGELDVTHPFHVLHTAKEAMRYLGGEGKFANRDTHPLPFLALLNLRLPGEDGFTLLRWLFDRPGLRKKFTLIALSAASPESEIQLAYELGVQSFLLKPLNYQDLVTVLGHVKNYWMDLNLLPGDRP